MDSTAVTTSTGTSQVEPELAGHRERMGPDPRVGAALAVLVGVVVLWFMYRIRRTFGMK